LVSPSARTLETWSLAYVAFTPPPATAKDERIYEAATATLFEVVAAAPTHAESVILVGHNPGLHELAVALIASGDIEAREHLREELQTSGLAVIDFAFDDWSKLHGLCGRLARFVTPKILAATAR
ncbi:MAG: histidine phosphatase family protein, partial [Pseudolabrys sp.]|nr:histidine phosphatase family protein [Pseudolabrys sp.]